VAVKQSWYSTVVVVVLFLGYATGIPLCSEHCGSQLGQLVPQAEKPFGCRKELYVVEKLGSWTFGTQTLVLQKGLTGRYFQVSWPWLQRSASRAPQALQFELYTILM
jgi:hypothetical protein